MGVVILNGTHAVVVTVVVVVATLCVLAYVYIKARWF